MDIFSFTFNSKSNTFEINFNDVIYFMQIDKASFSNIKADYENAYVFDINNNINLAVFEETNKLNISLSKEDFTPQSITINFSDVTEIATNSSLGIIHFNDNNNLKIQTFDCTLIKVNTNSIRIKFNNKLSKIVIFREGSFSIFSPAVDSDPQPEPPVSILTDVSAFVLSGSRGPEFSLGLFDEYTDGLHLRARPIRLGLPVISMVPSYSPNLTEQDLT